MMKYFLFIAFLFSASTLSAQKDILASKYTVTGITVDGSGFEWDSPRHYNDDKVSYSVSNDNENFYLIIQSLNRPVQQKIMRSGMTVTLSTSGKDKVKLAVLFPLKAEALNNSERLAPDSRGNPPGSDQRNAMRQQFIERCTEMKIKGVKSIKGNIPLANDYGILAAIDWEAENLLTYELQVPIDKLISSANPDNFANTEISVKIQVNQLPQPNAGGGGRTSGGGSGGRGGGRSRGGGSMSGGGAPGAQAGGGSSAMFVPDIFKSKFTLSRSK